MLHYIKSTNTFNADLVLLLPTNSKINYKKEPCYVFKNLSQTHNTAKFEIYENHFKLAPQATLAVNKKQFDENYEQETINKFKELNKNSRISQTSVLNLGKKNKVICVSIPDSDSDSDSK